MNENKGILGTPQEIIQVFNGYINDRNLESLASMMSEDHTFIDSSDEIHQGKERLVADWKKFFTRYPDYKNHFTYLETRGDQVLVLGYSSCSYEALDGPALWTALVQGGLVAEWRVYLDTEENRRNLNLPLGV